MSPVHRGRGLAEGPPRTSGPFQLSRDQLEAAHLLAGAVRVVAGAGTGKTAVIAARFVRLVEAGVSPAAILVMTFTERAAAEMLERILASSGVQEAPWVGTFHSLAMRWLREDGRRLGLNPAFRILAGPERWIVMRELMWDLADPALIGVERPDDMISPLLKLLERVKQELVPLGRLARWVSKVEDSERREVLAAAVRLFRAYGARCRKDGVMDFDDLLWHSVRLLQEHRDVRERLADRLRWVLVDEYQDTNLAQERLVELIAGGGGNVCVVGDDDQSIYRFRGASRANMDRFLASFPAAVTVTLGRNRRSTRRIVTAACRLVEHNPERLAKPLGPDPDQELGQPVEVWRCATAEQEAAQIAAEAALAHAAGVPLHSVAVLARTHAIARPVATALAAAGVPYQQWSGQGLFRRPEIRDLIAYLRLLHDPADLLALARLVARPPMSVDLEEALRHAREGDVAQPPLNGLKRWQPTARWAEQVLELSAMKATHGVDELLFELLSRTRYLDLVLPLMQDDLEARRVMANVSRFADFVSEYCERRRDHSLGLFVEHIDLVLRSGLDEDVADVDGTQDAVQLMTIHQAKGLQFDLVFVPALVDGRLPQSRRRDELTAIASLEMPAHLLEPAVRGGEDHLAEERRLCYVAMTRARRRLVLSWAERYDGGRNWRRSRFLTELGEGVVERDLRTPQPVLSLQREGGEKPEQEEEPLLSFSAISAYRECPRQHWYRYRLRLPATPGVEAQFGTALHLVLMRAGRLRAEGREVTAELLRELHEEAWDTIVLTEPRRRSALKALSWRLLGRFLSAGGLDAQPRLVEAPFAVSQDGWTLRGVIDRVDPPVDGSRAWRIIDYKTGSPVTASRLRRDLQLALYALGASQALGVDPVVLEIVYLKNGRRVVVPATDELLAQARQIGTEAAEGIRSGRFEPRPERRRCSLCGYRLACEVAL
ncbi:MAG TPA: ATP-dependent DNA helicase [Candidatus Dormibacteraeota bacterium]|nr:ATP-dependent DNA helicase [Candidatus Dormibacteraeota bacterium]